MIGTHLGQYRIDALLGQGGMGAVYLATDQMLGRQVAIKVLREEATSQATATERFRGEAQILARLDHPHILRLHGFSQDAGVLYMVTEFVKGEALQKRIEQGVPLDLAQVTTWAGHVLDALDYAHHLGVVHRDIKPANILIDERGRARLLDFGIARIMGSEGLTQTGHAVGTLTYMAPEQVLDETIDGRADIYAFAVVLCQMLSGRRPYRSTTTAGLIREIVEGPVPDLAGLLPPQAAAYVPVLLRALARRPADRTPTAALLRQELEAIARTGVPTPPPLPPLAPTGLPPITHGVTSTSAPATTSGAHATPTITAHAVSITDERALLPPTMPAAGSRPGAPVPPVRRSIALAYAIPVMLLVAAALTAWALFGRPRLVTPTIVAGPPGATATPADATDAPAPSATAAPAGANAGALQSPAPPIAEARRATRPPAPVPAAPRAATGAPPAAITPASPAEPAPPEPLPAAPVASTTASAGVEFTDLILMDRVDDEDEEIDVTLRLDDERLVAVDEDEVAKRTVAYGAITRATYTTRKPGRFSLRRAPSHWLTLQVGATPVVLRLNGRSYEQVLTTLEGHGVRVERQP
jgi:serine/threonine-protein kinase